MVDLCREANGDSVNIAGLSVNHRIDYLNSMDSGERGQFARHCHEGYEIYYFVRGEVCYLLEGKQVDLKPYSVLLLSPQVFHGVRILGTIPYERFTVHFSPTLLSSERSSMLLSAFKAAERVAENSNGVHFSQIQPFNIIPYLTQLIACGTEISKETQDLQEISLQIRLEALLSQITIMTLRENNSSDSPKNLCKESTQTAIHSQHTVTEKLIPYLNKNLTSPLSLDQIAEKFYISKYYLNTVFKRDTGTTVMDYVIHKRAALARRLICEGMKPAQASEYAGFGDYSVFYRTYKRIYGISPGTRSK